MAIALVVAVAVAFYSLWSARPRPADHGADEQWAYWGAIRLAGATREGGK
jgi:hypothetical protein